MDDIRITKLRLLLDIMRALAIMSLCAILLILFSSVLVFLDVDQWIQVLAGYYSLIPFLALFLMIFGAMSIGIAVITTSHTYNLNYEVD